MVAGNDDALYVSSVVLATQTRRFYAVDALTGSVKWTLDSQNGMCTAALIGSDGTVYFKDFGGIIYAVETNSGGLPKSPWPRSGANNQNTSGVNQ
jgi:outer membrane protein assembly factor BamB